MMRKIFALCLTTVLLTWMSSCVQPRDLSQNLVLFHLSSQPDGLHPFNNNSGNRTIIFNYTQKSLIKLDLGTLEYFPELITSMPEISEDQLRYTYHLRKDVFWDDGTPLTARDVQFSSKIQICPLTDNAAIRGIYDTVIKDVIVDPDDPYSFTMVAHKVHASNADIYTEIYIQQKNYWDPDGVLDRYSFDDFYNPKWEAGQDLVEWMNDFNSADNSFKPENLVGLGPYQVTDWETDSYITLKRKDNWWGRNDTSRYNHAYPEKIIFNIIKDGASTKMSLKNQNLDVSVQLGNNALRKMKKLDYFNEAFSSDFLDEYAYAYIGLNMRPSAGRTPFFEDRRVRRAMAYATPVDEMIDVLLYGFGKRQVANVSPLKKSYNEKLKPIPFNLDSAAWLLEQAGWVDTDGDNIRDKVIDGKKQQFIFDFHYFGNSSGSKEMTLMCKEEYYKVGVGVNPVPLDFTILYKRAYEHDFDAMMGVWGGSGSYSDPEQLWHTRSWVNKGSNFFGFGDAESDSLIQVCNSMVLAEDRIEPLKALQKKIYDDQPYLFLYSRVRATAIHNRFDNQEMYSEKPGLITNNLKLKPEYAGRALKPEEI